MQMNILKSCLLAIMVTAWVPVAMASETSDECIEARDSARDAAETLASAAEELYSCAKKMDFDDNCSSELDDVESAKDDYEYLVADVSSACM